MKNAKRVLAMIMALVLCLSALSVAAFAADPDDASGDAAGVGSITITPPAGSGLTMTGRVFKIYRIFDAYVDSEDTSRISYDWNHSTTDAKESTYSADFAPSKTIDDTDACMGPYFAFFFDPAENNGTARVSSTGSKLSAAMQYIRNNMTDAAKTAALGNALKDYIAKHEIKDNTPAESTNTTSSVVFANIPYGYYLVQEVSTDEKLTVISALMLDTTAPSANITLKAVQPTVQKTVVSVNGDEDVNPEGTAAQIGDSIVFKIALDVPDISKSLNSRGFYWYHLQDVASDGLTVEDEELFDLSLWRDGVKVQDLVINEDYLVLPDSYEEALSVIKNGVDLDGNAVDPKYRMICSELMCYIFLEKHNYEGKADAEIIALATGLLENANINLAENYAAFTAGGGGIVFRLTTSSVYKAGDVIEVLVDAVVNEDVVNNKTENTAKLHYSKNTQIKDPDPGNITTTEDKAKVYTHTLNLGKVAMDAEGNATVTYLTGAKFEIYKETKAATETAEAELELLSFNVINEGYKVNKDPIEGEDVDEDLIDAEAITVLEVDEAGRLYVTGLGDGVYYLKEVEAPIGYVIAENMLKLVIDATYDENGAPLTLVANAGDADTTGANIVDLSAFKATQIITGSITNLIGGVLPSTGGNGTMIFTLVGILGGGLMLTLLVLEIRKRKLAK